ncbi:CPBP family intramembrane metalloprotease [bacterium]|nr:CPBP family intramembrane metalloprotease [bacterium]MBP9810281.1 CPBP family intramembrane metalloprotease [bacterium]
MTSDIKPPTQAEKGFQAKQLALALAKSLIFLFFGIYACHPLFAAFPALHPTAFAQFFTYLLWSLLLLWLVARFIEKRKLSDYGLGAKSLWDGLLEFYDGSLIGSLLVTSVTLILAAIGCYLPLAINSSCDLLALIPGLIAAALFEEILFRGYVLQTIERASNTKTAVIISSLLFGAAHLTNFHGSEPLLTQIASCTVLGLDAGLLFCAAYLLTRRLWMAAGLHAFWNIFEGPIFGTPVSGLYMGEPLIISSLDGPALLTGGSFGPEASIIELTICLLLAWAMWRKSQAKAQQKI